MYAEMRKVGHVKSVTSAYRGGFHGYPMQVQKIWDKNSVEHHQPTNITSEIFIKQCLKDFYMKMKNNPSDKC